MQANVAAKYTQIGSIPKMSAEGSDWREPKYASPPASPPAVAGTVVAFGRVERNINIRFFRYSNAFTDNFPSPFPSPYGKIIRPWQNPSSLFTLVRQSSSVELSVHYV